MSGELHVRFLVGEEHYALPVSHVREIVVARDLSPVPGADAFVLGVQNLRGEVLPVFDLARVMGVDVDAAPPQQLLIAELDGRRAGLAIGEVTDVEPLADMEPRLDPEDLITGTLVHDDELVAVLSPQQIFARLETAGRRGG